MPTTRLRLLLAVLIPLCGVAGHPAAGDAPSLADKKALTLAGARQVAAAAEAVAVHNGFRQSVVVLDDGGNLLLFHRMDGAQLAGFEVAMAKARTALFFQTPSKSFADRVLAGQTNVLGLPGAAPVDGGVPLMHDGQLVGALGVTSASPAQDGQTATEAATALK